jgi:hypothetical protein
MSEILGMGLSHYPGLLVPTQHWTNLLRRSVEIGRVAPELFSDRSKWPKPMLEEWGSDEGVSAARVHEQRLLEGFRAMRKALDAFAPDLIVIWGDDQYENFRNDCVPAFCVYIFDELECRPYGGGRRPFKSTESAYGLPPETVLRVRGKREAAVGLSRELLGKGFDIAYATETRAEAGLAHSFNNTLVYLDRERRGFDYPVLPFHVNCYGNQLLRGARADATVRKNSLEISPPSPSPRRCFDIGRATARFFADSPWRVALIASSSWSHATLTAKHGRLYPDLPADRKLHAELVDGGFTRWGELPLADIEDAGQHEVLNWVCLAGAMSELGMRAASADLVESHLFNSSKCFALFHSA